MAGYYDSDNKENEKWTEKIATNSWSNEGNSECLLYLQSGCDFQGN
jgi:hypothetical protein